MDVVCEYRCTYSSAICAYAHIYVGVCMCVWVYVCIYAYIYVCICMYACVFVRGSIHVSVFSLAYLVVFCIFSFCTRNHAYACICRNTGHLYIYIHIHICTHIYIYIYMYTLSCKYTCIHTNTYVYICINTYIHPHTHTHAYIYMCICTNCRGIRTSVLTYYIQYPTPPLSRLLTVRNTSTPFSCKKTREEGGRSEERRVGKECRSRWSPYH